MDKCPWCIRKNEVELTRNFKREGGSRRQKITMHSMENRNIQPEHKTTRHYS